MVWCTPVGDTKFESVTIQAASGSDLNWWIQLSVVVDSEGAVEINGEPVSKLNSAYYFQVFTFPSYYGGSATLSAMEYRTQVTVGLVGGMAHLIAVLIFTFLYVSASGVEFRISAFVRGGVPLVVLTLLGAWGVLLYYNTGVISPTALIIAFDIVAILSSTPEVWTVPTPAGPPSFYDFYIFFFIGPLAIAVLMGVIEYFSRKRLHSQTPRPGL